LSVGYANGGAAKSHVSGVVSAKLTSKTVCSGNAAGVGNAAGGASNGFNIKGTIAESLTRIWVVSTTVAFTVGRTAAASGVASVWSVAGRNTVIRVSVGAWNQGAKCVGW
jgi:hypothetical protein